MLYLYDNAIADDLQSAIDPSGMNANVRVMEADGILGLMAQLEEDKITFPLICLVRDSDLTFDNELSNFTRTHVGHAEVMDLSTNTLYLERSIPVELKYALHVLTTNTADMDELIREITFRYLSMYFLTIDKPYEGQSKLRFGVAIPPGTQIRRESGSGDYIKEGKLYESVIPLVCQGTVMLNYVPKHMIRVTADVEVK